MSRIALEATGHYWLALYQRLNDDGYEVVVNPALRYDVAIDDFESEVALAKVELCERNGKIESRFFFRGEPRGDGVAHQATITATANGVTSAPTEPVTVEVRHP